MVNCKQPLYILWLAGSCFPMLDSKNINARVPSAAQLNMTAGDYPLFRIMYLSGGYLLLAAVLLLPANYGLAPSFVPERYVLGGVDLAWLLVGGWGYLPLLLVPVLAAVIFGGGATLPIWLLFGHAVIRMAAYSLAAGGMRRLWQKSLNSRWTLKRLVRLLLLTVTISFFVAALTIVSLSMAGVSLDRPYSNLLFVIWVNEMLSLLGFTPFLVSSLLQIRKIHLTATGDSWPQRLKAALSTVFQPVTPEKVAEIAVVSSGFILIFWLTFVSPFAFSGNLFFLIFLPLTWITIRYGLRGAISGIAGVQAGIVVAWHFVGQATAADLFGFEIPALSLYIIIIFLGWAITERETEKIARERLLAAERKQRLIAETLADVTLALTSQHSASAVLNEILRQVQRLVPYKTAHIVLLEGENLRIAYWQGYQNFGSERLIANLTQPLADFPLDAEVIYSREPLLIYDTRQEARWVVQAETAWVRCHVVLPVVHGGQVLGLLRLDADEPGAFTHKMLTVLQPLINSAAIALENARLYEQAQQEITDRKRAEQAAQDSLNQLTGAYEQTIIYAQELNAEAAERKRAEEQIRRRNRELTLLNRVIVASAKGLSEQSVLQITCNELALAFDMARVVALLFDAGRRQAVRVAYYQSDGWLDDPVEAVSPADDPLAAYLQKHKTPLVVGNMHTESRIEAIRQAPHTRGASALLALPLVTGGDMVGYFALSGLDARAFSSEEVDLAWRVADQVAGAIMRARLDKSRRQLSAAIEQAAESVVITDTGGYIVYTNPAYEQTSLYAKDEVLGRNWLAQCRSEKHNDAFYTHIWTTLRAGNVWQGHMVSRKKDGSLFTEDTTVAPIRNEHGAIVNYVSVQRDITRELQLEEQYYQAQKMEAIGRLTGGIAHDFNNLLTAINGFVGILQSKLSADDPSRDVVDKIQSTGQRAVNLIDQLMAFSRKRGGNPQIINLNDVVMNIGSMLQPIIGRDVNLETRLLPDLWYIKIDPTQLEQVIVNLVVNARDAMPVGGQLTIVTTNVVLPKQDTNHRLGVEPGPYVRLLLQDTGSGMTDEVKARIFEPFFTTKAEGKGTGLGLATTFGIVERSGGHIKVESEVGRGTTFKIYLPRTTEAPETNRVPRRVRAAEMPIGTETVLIVEDEPAIRNLAVRLLSRQGYHVLEAADGRQAIQHAEQYQGVIHLLLTDMVMPDVNGQELAARVKNRRAETKVLYMSGHKEEAIVPDDGLDSKKRFIQKPFSAVDLVRKVRAVLDTGH